MMRSLGSDQVVKNKAMWLYPKVSDFNPSERWGHSACCYSGVVYIFGGCCGGLHFSDVLALDLDKMTWNTLVTTGQQPGARDSHSSVLVNHRMIVFGGTNGSKKVNDLHVLDLRTKEWSSPKCEGTPPPPRESHTATVVSDDKLVIFGGSGEGDANYLNDLHVLDLKTMRWTSPEIKGDIPAPRDSHVSLAIGNKLLVYGGDCGDRYHGEVDVLDMETYCWSRLVLQGSSPGIRAGHAAVAIGSKVFILGGVGDKLYYNDVWILDVSTCSWCKLGIMGHQPQGRFSHTAVLTESDIVIYGGCGEDERPLNELLILQLGAEHPKGRYNISMCKTFGNHLNRDKHRIPRGKDTTSVFVTTMVRNHIVCEPDAEHSLSHISENLHPKKKRTSGLTAWEIESEQEEHSLSLSQHSSPSQSDHEQTPVQKLPTEATKSVTCSHPIRTFGQPNQMPNNQHSNNIATNQPEKNSSIQRNPRGIHFMGGEHRRHLKPRQCLQQQEVKYMGTEQRPLERGPIHSLIGADIRGKVDGAFDSGYLMTANVNGKIMRGVLFTPGLGFAPRAAVFPQTPPTASHIALAQQYSNSNCIGPSYSYGGSYQQPITLTTPERGHQLLKTHSFPLVKSTNNPSLTRSSSGLGSDLQDVVLTLGGGHG
ncbi:Rab9 effector protein [Thalictrum thalictroides]|uniref:Rab9 effector protein n=1 Tax=Thalictrum thalictroides TaxID=46969 RepID=A0A7J6WAQ9_THATH|nr:Rab9 effector protein [Thalictrum thalictroides]